MATELKKTDVVVVGTGFAGGIVASECAKAGLSVVGLEKGRDRRLEDFAHTHDEWRYGINYGLMQDLSIETITFQNNRDMQSLPMRRLGSFLLGEGLGGAGIHWSGFNMRFFPYDFNIKTITEERYGANKLSNDYTYMDWPLTYDEIEPYYSKFDLHIGTSGESISPFDGHRSVPYPCPPLIKTPALQMFEAGAQSLGLHPYMRPSANISQPYTNPDGMELDPCAYCGYCERFACEHNAKASPVNLFIPVAERTGNFELRCNANVVEVLKRGKKVTGVKYINTLTREEFIQPADVVVLGSYVFNNAKLLMVSRIGRQYDPRTGRGTLGKNYCYQLTPSVTGFFEDEMNLYAGAGSLGMCLDDYNGDNFDHSDLDFIHGTLTLMTQGGRRPLQSNTVPPGTPSWGAEFKRQSIYYHNRVLSVNGQAASIPHKENYLSLDDTYKDAYGLPLLRMTYNFTDQDRALVRYLKPKIAEIVSAMGAEIVAPSADLTNYNILPYQSTHNTGGTIMGKSSRDSVVNSYTQHWDAENLFVVGAGNFAHNGGCNPTATVGALAFRCAEGVIKYSQGGGGSLV